jgi:hypothetical protein
MSPQLSAQIHTIQKSGFRSKPHVKGTSGKRGTPKIQRHRSVNKQMENGRQQAD